MRAGGLKTLKNWLSEYVRLVALRSPYAESDLVIIEGYDGPQP